LSPAKRRAAIEHVKVVFPEVSERRFCRLMSQARSTQRRRLKRRPDEDMLTGRVMELAVVFGRYGTPRITALLRREGWRINHKRVERIWKREGLKVPSRQRKRGRIWLNDGSCVRRRAEYRNHVWSYDFVEDQTRDGRKLKFLNVVDEWTRKSLAIMVGRSFTSLDVLSCLAELFLTEGLPEYIRSDNGPEFVANKLRAWLLGLEVRTLYLEPGSPWENGYIESFNGKFQAEFLSMEIFDTLAEARVLTERWRRYYNTQRPHSSLSYRPPAPESFEPPVRPAKALEMVGWA